MIKRIKYIKTKIDDEVKIMKMTFCNFCPLLVFDVNNKKVSCSKFFNLTIINNRHEFDYTIKHKAIGYRYFVGNCAPLEKIDIPYWCNLNNNEVKTKYDMCVYVKVGNNKFKKTADLLTNRDVIPSDNVELDTNLINLITKKNYKITNNTLKQDNKINSSLKTCSSCGHSKTDVNRNKNLGMCNKCKENNKDYQKKYFSYINNFRLKRNLDWKENILKKLDKIDMKL